MDPSMCLRRDCWPAWHAASSTRSSSASGCGSTPGRRPHVLRQAPQVVGNVGAEAHEVDLACPQHGGGVRVLRQRQQEMLEQKRAMRLLAREVLRPPEAALEIGRHRNRRELVRNRLRHQRFPPHPARTPDTPIPRPGGRLAGGWRLPPELRTSALPLPHKPVREQGGIRPAKPPPGTTFADPLARPSRWALLLPTPWQKPLRGHNARYKCVPLQPEAVESESNGEGPAAEQRTATPAETGAPPALPTSRRRRRRRAFWPRRFPTCSATAARR